MDVFLLKSETYKTIPNYFSLLGPTYSDHEKSTRGRLGHFFFFSFSPLVFYVIAKCAQPVSA